MNKEDKTGLLVLLGLGVIGLIITVWLSNTSFCLNYRKDMLDYIERFKWCAVRIDYLK